MKISQASNQSAVILGFGLGGLCGNLGIEEIPKGFVDGRVIFWFFGCLDYGKILGELELHCSGLHGRSSSGGEGSMAFHEHSLFGLPRYWV